MSTLVPFSEPHRGSLPTFFRACCLEASQCSADGVRVGYDHPGYHLMLHIEQQCPYDVENDDWEQALDRLRYSIQRLSDAKVLDWFCRWTPRCMALVPRRRRTSFLKGVYRCAAHAGLLSKDDLEAVG